MKLKRLILITMLLFGLELTELHAQTMYVRETSSTQTAYLLSNIKKVSFSSGNIILSKNTGAPNSYLISDIRFLTFQDLITHIATLEKQEEALRLYPNPVVDKLNIPLSLAKSQECLIDIISIEGRVVYREKINPHDNVYQINVSALPCGIYICKINNGIATKTAKFIK